MKIPDISSNKLWIIISSIASSILTNIIYDSIFPTTYIIYIDKSNQNMYIKPIDNNISNILAIFMILFIFVFVWFFIAYATPYILNKVKFHTPFKKKRVGYKQLIYIYQKSKKEIQEIDEKCGNWSTIKSLLYFEEIQTITNQLYNAFSTASKHSIEYAFNKYNSFKSTGKYISTYEYSYFIRYLEKIVNNIILVKATHTSLLGNTEHLFDSTANKLLKIIEELKKFPD